MTRCKNCMRTLALALTLVLSLSISVPARAAVDETETLTASDCWPYPTYGDLLFSVR